MSDERYDKCDRCRTYSTVLMHGLCVSCASAEVAALRAHLATAEAALKAVTDERDGVIAALGVEEDTAHGRSLVDAAQANADAFRSACDMMLEAERDRDEALASRDAEIGRLRAALDGAITAMANVGSEVRVWLNNVGLLGQLDRAIENALTALAPVAEDSK